MKRWRMSFAASITLTAGLLLAAATSMAQQGGNPPQGSGQQSGVVTVFPARAIVGVGDSVQFEVGGCDSTGAEIDSLAAVWSVSDTLLGSVTAEGLFIAKAVGTVGVIALTDVGADTATVVVEAVTPTPQLGRHRIRIRREIGDRVRDFGHVRAEGDTIVIGGLPFPYNYLNGTKLLFPEGSLAEDITLTVRIPVFSKVDLKKREVGFVSRMVMAVTFEVSVGDTVVQGHYTFLKPIKVWMPFKRGLLRRLGVTPDSLRVRFANEFGTIEEGGIGECVLEEEQEQLQNEDEERLMLAAEVEHFSTLAVTPGADTPTAVNDAAPVSFSLAPAQPNPFNPSTTLTFRIADEGHVELAIFSITGQRVRTLVNDIQRAGSTSVVWDGRDEYGVSVTSGVYISRLATASGVAVQKIMLVK